MCYLKFNNVIFSCAELIELNPKLYNELFDNKTTKKQCSGKCKNGTMCLKTVSSYIIKREKRQNFGNYLISTSCWLSKGQKWFCHLHLEQNQLPYFEEEYKGRKKPYIEIHTGLIDRIELMLLTGMTEQEIKEYIKKNYKDYHFTNVEMLDQYFKDIEEVFTAPINKDKYTPDYY